MLFISIRERTGGGKDRENDPKGKDTKRQSGKKVILGAAAGEWRKERKTLTAEQTNYTSLLMQTAFVLMPHALPFSPTQGADLQHSALYYHAQAQMHADTKASQRRVQSWLQSNGDNWCRLISPSVSEVKLGTHKYSIRTSEITETPLARIKGKFF